MGFIEDISSLIRKGPEVASQIDNFKLNNKSIARGAKDSTFQFPCIIVNTIKGEDANVIARTLDKVYATFAQTWLSMNSTFDITLDPTPLSYLKRIHQNTNFESSEEDELLEESDAKLYWASDDSFGMLFTPIYENTGDIGRSNREGLREYLSDYNLSPFEVVGEAKSDQTSFQDFANAAISGVANAKRTDAMLKAAGKSFAPKLTDRDLKKSNDLLPYAIEVRLIAVNARKEFVNFVDVVIGIKTILHSVSSEEMVKNIGMIMMNRDPLFKFLKWTTGEISFFKDLVLNLNEIRYNAASTGKGKLPYFNTLQRLKKQKIAMNNFTSPRFILPNSTFVLSTYEVDVLRDQYGVDLRDATTAKSLINKLFLIGLVIVDVTDDSLKVMYDGDSSFQYYSLSVLERENLTNQTLLNREIGRMLTR